LLQRLPTWPVSARMTSPNISNHCGAPILSLLPFVHAMTAMVL
jgi:hypothetical protein